LPFFLYNLYKVKKYFGEPLPYRQLFLTSSIVIEPKSDEFMESLISWQDFAKVDIRVGTIIKVEDFPKARNPSYQIRIDFGDNIGIKKSSAQLTDRYTKEALLGKQVAAVVNFPKKQIANFMSECLILGAVDGKDVILLQPETTALNGLKIS